MKEEIAKTIATKQKEIEELQKIKELVKDNIEANTKLNITTKHIAAYFEPHTIKRKSIIDISNSTITLLLNEMIEKQKAYIDKLIDTEIEERKNSNGKK